MPPAERVATLRDIAEHAGVHVATASRALNAKQSHLVTESTRARVHDAAAALGYRANALARSLRSGKSGTIGIVVADFANPFIVTLIRGVEDETRAHDLLPLVVETRDDPQSLRLAIKRLLDNRVDAIILTAAHLGDQSYVTEISAQVPIILAVRGFSIGGLSLGEVGSKDEPRIKDEPRTKTRRLQVLQDDFLGARSAVHELLSLGHRRIAQISGAEHISSFVNRGRGFTDAISGFDGAVDVSTGEHALESTVAEGQRLASELFARPREEQPTAVFAHNDLMAVGALDALREAGLHCPADVSVIGYNDAPLVDHMDPPLSTVKLPAREIGRQSAKLALAAINGDDLRPTQIMLTPEYVNRQSTAQAPSTSVE